MYLLEPANEELGLVLRLVNLAVLHLLEEVPLPTLPRPHRLQLGLLFQGQPKSRNSNAVDVWEWREKERR